jgi:hypothetical protein
MQLESANFSCLLHVQKATVLLELYRHSPELNSVKLRISRLVHVLNKVKNGIFEISRIFIRGNVIGMGRKWLKDTAGRLRPVPATFQAVESGRQMCTLVGPQVFKHTIDHTHELLTELRNFQLVSVPSGT